MNLIKDLFLVEADKDLNKTLNIKCPNGNLMYVDTDIDHYNFATQIGTITHVPKFIDDKYIYDNPLKVGDIVIFHHFVVQPTSRVIVDGKTLYKANYFHIWCKIENNTIIPLEDFIFVEPIMDTEKDLFLGKLQLKTDKEVKKHRGIVSASGSMPLKNGVSVSDVVYFTKNADYSIKILDRTFYRMRLRNITGIEKDGELTCLSDKILVKEESAIKMLGKLMIYDDKRECRGIILSVGENVEGFSVGDRISYFKGVSQSIEINGAELILINRDNVNYIINNDMRILPTQTSNRVVIKQSSAETKMGNIFIPETVSEKPLKGVVVAISDGYVSEKNGHVPPYAKVGDTVLYAKHTGTPIEKDGEELILLLESDIFAIL